jgi:hypothetical protein
MLVRSLRFVIGHLASPNDISLISWQKTTSWTTKTEPRARPMATSSLSAQRQFRSVPRSNRLGSIRSNHPKWNGIEQGEFRRIDNFPLTTLSLFGMVNWGYPWVHDSSQPSREIAMRFWELYLHGIAADSRSPTQFNFRYLARTLLGANT